MNKQVYNNQIASDFAKVFDARPTHIAIAPGRVNLIGEHIDYCDGFVLPMAIEKHVFVAFRKNGSTRARIVSSDHSDELVEFDLNSEQSTGVPRWADYPKGVIQLIREQFRADVSGFDAMIFADLPMGAGLSSSAALELATATMVEHLAGIKMQNDERALLCQRAENQFVGVPCGVMDQLASACSSRDHLTLIDCRSREVKLVPFASERAAILIANSNVKHELGESQYAVRRKQTEDALEALNKKSWRDVTVEDLDNCDSLASSNVLFRRARHVVGEIHRTVAAADMIVSNDFEGFGQLMYDSHRSLRNDFEVSCDELDCLVEIASAIGPVGGVYGSRMTGGGFGGSTVTLADVEHVDSITRTIASEYASRTGFAPDIFVSAPADGAKLIDLDDPG